MTTISAVRTSALGFAARVHEGDAVDVAYSTAIKAKEDSAASPYAIFKALLTTFGNDLQSWPKPGTGTKDNEPNSNNPDYWEKPSGDTKIKGSFYNDFADNTPKGKWIAGELAKIAEGSREGGEDNEYRKMGTGLKREKAKWAMRQSTLRSNTRLAMKFLFHMERVNSMPGITVEMDDRYNGAIVADDKVRANVKHYSVKGFLALKPGKAMDEGGGWEKLVTSDARPPRTPEQAGDVIKLGNWKQVESAMSELVVIFEAARNDEDKRKKLLKTLNAAGSDDLLANIFRFEEAAAHITSLPEFEKRWQEDLRGKQKVG